MGVSQDDALSVAVESLRGALAHNSRANEGFGITVVEPGGTRLENANLQLFVRMPQHDRRMPGGHGPANDPDVKGLVAMPEGRGRYRVNTVDFSMPGPWLLEVVVTNGGDSFNFSNGKSPCVSWGMKVGRLEEPRVLSQVMS